MRTQFHVVGKSWSPGVGWPMPGYCYSSSFALLATRSCTGGKPRDLKIGTVTSSIEPWLWHRYTRDRLRQKNTMGTWKMLGGCTECCQEHASQERTKVQTCSRRIMTTQWRLPLALSQSYAMLRGAGWPCVFGCGRRCSGSRCSCYPSCNGLGNGREWNGVWRCVVICESYLLICLWFCKRARRIQPHSRWWKICQHQGATKKAQNKSFGKCKRQPICGYVFESKTNLPRTECCLDAQIPYWLSSVTDAPSKESGSCSTIHQAVQPLCKGRRTCCLHHLHSYLVRNS